MKTPSSISSTFDHYLRGCESTFQLKSVFFFKKKTKSKYGQIVTLLLKVKGKYISDLYLQWIRLIRKCIKHNRVKSKILVICLAIGDDINHSKS